MFSNGKYNNNNTRTEKRDLLRRKNIKFIKKDGIKKSFVLYFIMLLFYVCLKAFLK